MICHNIHRPGVVAFLFGVMFTPQDSGNGIENDVLRASLEIGTVPSGSDRNPEGSPARCRRTVRRVLAHWCMQLVFTLAIFVNIVVLAMDYYEAPPAVHQFIAITNVVCLCFFVVEILLKWVAYGIVNYFKTPFNILDFSLVLLSVIEFAVAQNASLSALRSLRGLKVMRLLLIGRLAHHIRALSLLLGVFCECFSRCG